MSALYEISTPPASSPVTVAEAKEFARVEHSDDDTLFAGLITAATDTAEAYTNRCFVERTIIGHYPGLCESKLESSQFIKIHRAPVLSITSIEVHDGTSWTAVDSADYQFKNTNGGFPKVLFPNGLTYGTSEVYPVKITFTAGYQTVPEAIKLAVKQVVNFWYENRDDAIADGDIGFPLGAKVVLRKNYKIIDTF